MSYAAVPTTGTLLITVSVGEAVAVSVSVTGPNGYSHAVTRTDTLSSLPPGTYTVAAQPITGSTGVNYGRRPPHSRPTCKWGRQRPP